MKFKVTPESIKAATVEEKPGRKTERYSRLPEGLDNEVLKRAKRF